MDRYIENRGKNPIATILGKSSGESPPWFLDLLSFPTFGASGEEEERQYGLDFPISNERRHHTQSLLSRWTVRLFN
jgi:hypothetical protein